MRHKIFIFAIFIFLASFIMTAHAAEEIPELQITSVGVSGNSQITSEYILNVVDSKPGKVLSRDMLQSDVQAIYDQGFFSFVDVNLRPEGGGAAVEFSVQENPIIESINFTGNTIYTSEKLCFLAGRNSFQQNIFPQ